MGSQIIRCWISIQFFSVSIPIVYKLNERGDLISWEVELEAIEVYCDIGIYD